MCDEKLSVLPIDLVLTMDEPVPAIALAYWRMLCFSPASHYWPCLSQHDSLVKIVKMSDKMGFHIHEIPIVALLTDVMALVHDGINSKFPS